MVFLAKWSPMKRFVIAGVGVVVLVVAIAASRFTLSALPEPGRAETFLATKAKHYLVRRSSSDGVPPLDRVAGLKEEEGSSAWNVRHATGSAATIPRTRDAGCTRAPRI